MMIRRVSFSEAAEVPEPTPAEPASALQGGFVGPERQLAERRMWRCKTWL
jgi:hypothetical protein